MAAQLNNPGNLPPRRPFHIGDASSFGGGPFRLLETIRSTASTLDTSFSKANSNLMALTGPDFGRLYVGDKFLERLIAYIDPAYHHNIPEPRPPRCCIEVDGLRPQPPQEQVASAIGRLAGLEINIRAHACNIQPLTSNESVRDAVNKQVIDLLNLVIKTQEVNTIDEAHRPVPDPGSEVSVITERQAVAAQVARKAQPSSQWRDYFSGARGKVLPYNDVKQDYFFPSWGPPAPGHLKSQKETRAGKADWVLFASPGNSSRNIVACGEARVWWSYPTSKILDAFRGIKCVSDDPPHAFRMDLPPTDCIVELFKMLYGHLKALNAHIGWFTNMEVVFFYCLYKPEEKKRAARKGSQARSDTTLKIPRSKLTEHREPKSAPETEVPESGLVLSWPIPWKNEYTSLCLQGSSYLALDMDRLGMRDIVNIVAPGEERRQIVPGMIVPDNFGIQELLVPQAGPVHPDEHGPDDEDGGNSGEDEGENDEDGDDDEGENEDSADEE